MKLRFRGFLTNVDPSILNLKLKHRFEVKELSSKEAYNFIIAASYDGVVKNVTIAIWRLYLSIYLLFYYYANLPQQVIFWPYIQSGNTLSAVRIYKNNL